MLRIACQGCLVGARYPVVLWQQSLTCPLQGLHTSNQPPCSAESGKRGSGAFSVQIQNCDSKFRNSIQRQGAPCPTQTVLPGLQQRATSPASESPFVAQLVSLGNGGNAGQSQHRSAESPWSSAASPAPQRGQPQPIGHPQAKGNRRVWLQWWLQTLEPGRRAGTCRAPLPHPADALQGDPPTPRPHVASVAAHVWTLLALGPNRTPADVKETLNDPR